MVRKKDITSKGTSLNIGSMSFRIDILKREAVYAGTNTSFSFTIVYTVWADRETRDGLQKFSGINIDDVPSDLWKIRTIKNLTSEFWIRFDNELFRIIKVDTVNGGCHQIVSTRNTGSSSLNGSKS